MSTVSDVANIIEEIAKPQYAYEWDNCGLLVGNEKMEVFNILVTLDVTKEVVLEAIEKKCQMIISHHPLIFKAVKKICTDSYEGEIISLLYKNDIALYCAHTSLDKSQNGVNDAFAKRLELKNVKMSNPVLVEGESVSCVRQGSFENALNKKELLNFVKEKTGAGVLLYFLQDKIYNNVAFCTGAGEEYAFETKDVDVFITGEIKYHTALELKRQNISFISAGHYYTEVHIIKHLTDSLQKRFNMLQYNVIVLPSEINTNPFEN